LIRLLQFLLQRPKPLIPVAPISEEVMEIGEDDDASTSSVASSRTYASVTSNKLSPTVGNGETEIPSPVTDCAESSNYQSQIADLKSEMAESKAQFECTVAKLEAQLADLSRAPPGVRSTEETEISEASSVTATTPEVDSDRPVVQSPYLVVRSTASTVVSAPSTATASTLDVDLDASAVTLPLRILCGTQAMDHEPSSHDYTPASKRSR
jgi:hypothetical protein